MWTKINQVYSSPHSQNAWAHLVGTNKWHKILTGAADGVTNVFLILSTAKANDRQVYVTFDSPQNITAAYM
jgi:uncharacterized protein YbjT (DUF2867 family)